MHDTYLFSKKRGQKAHLEHTNLQYKLLDWKMALFTIMRMDFKHQLTFKSHQFVNIRSVGLIFTLTLNYRTSLILLSHPYERPAGGTEGDGW